MATKGGVSTDKAMKHRQVLDAGGQDLAAYNALPVTVSPSDFLAGHGNWGLSEAEYLVARRLARAIVANRDGALGVKGTSPGASGEDVCYGEATPRPMRRLDKPLLTPLPRENRGIKDDPQFSPYYPSMKYCVFYDYGHPTELGCNTFRTKG